MFQGMFDEIIGHLRDAASARAEHSRILARIEEGYKEVMANFDKLKADVEALEAAVAATPQAVAAVPVVDDQPDVDALAARVEKATADLAAKSEVPASTASAS